MDADFRAELILRCVECLPEGTAASYGDIAAIVGTGPRVVGRVMATYGSGVPWWRVTNAKGELPPALVPRALAQWKDEGITLAAHGRGIVLQHHRADLTALASQWRERVAGL